MKLVILVLEDEPEVRTALARDLTPFVDTVRIELAQDVPDAWQILDELDGDVLALILSDHRLPGRTGVDFLVETTTDPRARHARRVLVTGQAGHADTIRAINDGALDHYIAKPWEPAELQRIVREQLTDFVSENHLDPLPVMRALDPMRAMELVRSRPGGATT